MDSLNAVKSTSQKIGKALEQHNTRQFEELDASLAANSPNSTNLHTELMAKIAFCPLPSSSKGTREPLDLDRTPPQNDNPDHHQIQLQRVLHLRSMWADLCPKPNQKSH